jgi:hypothetical protein
MKRLALFCLVLLLAACGSPQVPTPSSTPQAITVIYPIALQPWVDRLGSCASKDPLTALYIQVSNNVAEKIMPDEISLALSPDEKQIGDYFASQVGREQVVVIVNSENPITELSKDKLKSIYTGRTTTWPSGDGQPAQIWVLPSDDPTRRIFDQVVLNGQAVTSEARLAPDPAAMFEAVSGDINAIGYLPMSYLGADSSNTTASVQEVHLDDSLRPALNQPVVALTLGEPEGLLRSLLVCLQSTTP